MTSMIATGEQDPTGAGGVCDWMLQPEGCLAISAPQGVAEWGDAKAGTVLQKQILQIQKYISP